MVNASPLIASLLVSTNRHQSRFIYDTRFDSPSIKLRQSIFLYNQNQDNQENDEGTDNGQHDNVADSFLDLLPELSASAPSEDVDDNHRESTTSPEKEKLVEIIPEKAKVVFDITQQWGVAGDTLQTFLERILSSSESKEHNDDENGEEKLKADTIDTEDVANETSHENIEEYEKKAQNLDPNEKMSQKTMQSSSSGSTNLLDPLRNLLNFADEDYSEKKGKEQANQWMEYISTAGEGTEQSIQDMIDKARSSTGSDDSDFTDQQSLQDILNMFREYSSSLKGTADKYFSDMDFSALRPASIFYFIEREDELKNPSWKRRIHRFHPVMNVQRMNELNDALTMARIGYFDSVDEVKERLLGLTESHELLYSCVEGEPQKPAHYLAIKKQQKTFSPSLELTMGIRGTKSIKDAITDLLFEDVEYREGKAHSGMLASGKYLADKHRPLLHDLLQSSGKQRMNIQIVGHSLGAGVAAIVALELRDDPKIDLEVVGFGCPATLSKNLSESMRDIMTTVVADDDVVPRLSAATVINALLDVMEHDFIPSARRDIQTTLQELRLAYPNIITGERAETFVQEVVDPLLEKYVAPTIQDPTEKRVAPVLYPPGEIVHLYRDGIGISNRIVPCTFYEEIDLKRTMIHDHLFHSGYERILLDVMRLHFQDHDFQFDNPVTPKNREE